MDPDGRSGPENLRELVLWKHHRRGAKDTVTLDYADLGDEVQEPTAPDVDRCDQCDELVNRIRNPANCPHCGEQFPGLGYTIT